MAKGLSSVPTLSAKEIAKKHGLPLAYISKQIAAGVKVEKEHTTSTKEANEIARDHISERPDYYIKLHKMEKSKVEVKEGISAGPERESDYTLGDAGGGSTLGRKLDVKEGAKLEKAKKAMMAGVTAANLYTAGDVASRAAEGRGGTKGDVVRMATTLPGAAGWAATGIHYAKKAYDKVKQMKEDKDPCWKGYEMVGMKKKGGRKVPNCVPVNETGQVMSRYTERPTYENKTTKGDVLPDVGGAARGIYEDDVEEGYALIGRPFNSFGDVNPRAKFYGKKPKPTTTKNDEKDDTYKDSKQGGKVKFAKTVKEGLTRLARDKGSLKRDEPITIMKRNDPLEQRKGKESARNQYQREFPADYARRKIAKTNMTPKDEIKASLGKHHKPGHLPEDWQSVNRKDKTDGLSQKAVDAYKRENPGSKLQTAVTEKNPTGKRASRRKSFCSRMGGMKKRLTSAKTARDPDSRINKALRRWNCEESVINELHGKGSLGALKDYHKAAEKVSTDNPNARSYHASSSRRAEYLANVVKAKKDIAKSTKHSTLEKGWRKLISAKDSAKDFGDYAKKDRKDMKKDGERIHNIYLKAKGVRNEQLDELKAETLGAYVKKASASRKKSLEGSKPDIKTWAKREHGIRAAIKKLTNEDVATATAAHAPSPQGLRPTTKLGRNAPTEISSRGSSQGLNRSGNTFRSSSSVTPQGRIAARSATATPGARMAPTASPMKPTSVSGPQAATPKTAAPTARGSFGTGGGSMKPSSVKGSMSMSQGGSGVGTKMAASKQTSPIVKGMSAAGSEASKKIVPKAASVIGTIGKAARALSGPEGAAVTAAAEPLAKKAAASYKAGHQSFTPHGAEGEKTSTVFNRMRQSQSSQGRSVSDYEKQVLTPKSSEAPKAAEAPRPKVDAPTPPTRPDYFSKGQAFSAARKEAGGGEGKFSYDSKSYQTNVKSEPYKPESQLKQTSIKEGTMDTKEQIQEAISNIMDENLNEMKDNFLAAIQEKAIQKLEERKKEIAANYFAQ